MNVLLAYVSLPFTTAAYWERALRRVVNVKTIGPKLPERLLIDWKLENMKSPVLAQDIPVAMDFDMSNFSEKLEEFRPDLYLWIESVPGYFPKNLHTINCPKACYLIDTYSSFDWHIDWAKNFDYVFLADLSFVERFKQAGINAFWLPLGCDPEIHMPQTLDKKHDIAFVGTVIQGTDRQRYLATLSNAHKVYYERSFLEEMARTFSQSKIVFNNAVGKTDLNMRFFEAMACGALLLSDMSQNSGQDILFEPHYDYALYNERNLVDIADYYLKDDLARESVAKNGQSLVIAAHTYQHRVDHMLEVVLGGRKNTFNPTEWRDLAAAEVAKQESQDHKKPYNQLISSKSITRSFIIPVLDYSPASPFNIKTLLENLSHIGGEVIVVFNNPQVADEIKNHPRIDHYAILKENIGVARAWNIGLDICRTDFAFILNADLHVDRLTIEKLQEALSTLPEAAIVGPQGSYFNFETLKDYIYLDKGTFNKVMEVDAVSGFLFGIKTKLFKQKILQFENDYTPCYFEEWDLGLQIKLAGLKSYVVPLTGYEHHWSGSIRSYRQITYYDKAQTSKQIQLRNAYLFQKKWLEIANTKSTKLLESGWKASALKMIEMLIKNNQTKQAIQLSNLLETHYQNDHEVFAAKGLSAYHHGEIESALNFYKKSISIQPAYTPALKNIQLINERHFPELIDALRRTKAEVVLEIIKNPFFNEEHEIICKSFNEIKGLIDSEILLKWMRENIEYLAKGIHSENAYRTLRAISIHSRFAFNQSAKKLFRNQFPSKLPSNEKSQDITLSLEKYGYSIIPPNDKSIKFALDTNKYLSNLRVRREKDGAINTLSVFIKNPLPGAFRYYFLEEELPVNPILNLLYEMGIIKGISDYIGHPIFRNINAWVSICPKNYDEIDISNAAQAYHYDNDNPTGWTKVFVYLTDVDDSTGPHVYVPSSHLQLPINLMRDGRFSDQEIESEIGKGLKIIGTAGTIIVADTLGMHKGLLVESGMRVIFQVEFCTSLLGAETPLNKNSRKILSNLPDFMDERLSYRYIRDVRMLNEKDSS